MNFCIKYKFTIKYEILNNSVSFGHVDMSFDKTAKSMTH
jgi:hypothetical protein